MLQELKQVINEFVVTRTIERKLQVLVASIKRTIQCEACSVFLVDEVSNQLVLMATDGFYQEAVGVTRIPIENSLAGLVAQRAEPISVADASKHPAYFYDSETGEEGLHGYLGVPVIHNRNVLAVITLNKKAATVFDVDSETFLLTAASQIADNLALARITQDLDDILHSDVPRGAYHPIKGLPGAPGIAMGKSCVMYTPTDISEIPDRVVTDIDAEISIFESAVKNVKRDIEKLKEKLTESVAENELALFDAYILMLDSQSLLGDALIRIRQGQWAQGALRDILQDYVSQFSKMDDSYLRERGSDILDLGRRVLRYLREDKTQQVTLPDKIILVGELLTPSNLAQVPIEKLIGVISRHGSRTSHLAIFARAMGIPAVMGVELLPINKIDGCDLILDGYKGCVYVSPADEIKQNYDKLIEDEARLTTKLLALSDQPAQTEDGHRVTFYVTSGLMAGFDPSESCRADGIGLYRTELPFMERQRFPSENEQCVIYRSILSQCAPRPVHLRTLDIGGDKALSYFPIVEENPFLGWRGIRITLDHPEIFVVQIRAMLRANIGLNNLHILLPMISNVAELNDSLALIHRVYGELLEEGLEVVMPKVGVMIEVPSAVYMAESLAKRVDFFSIGSNDLTQYLLAVDRNNARVAGLYDALHPAVLKAIYDVVKIGHAYDKPVGICGEMAGDPAAALLLVGMGLDSLSMSTSSLLRVKWVLRHFTKTRCRQILDDALKIEDAEGIRDYMNNILEVAGMGVLLGAQSKSAE